MNGIDISRTNQWITRHTVGARLQICAAVALAARARYRGAWKVLLHGLNRHRGRFDGSREGDDWLSATANRCRWMMQIEPPVGADSRGRRRWRRRHAAMLRSFTT